MNGSVVTASTAGMESTAKITSAVSTTTSATSSGVASRRPPSLTTNRWPCSRSPTGSTRRTTRSTRGSRGAAWLSPRSMLAAATSRMAPKT